MQRFDDPTQTIRVGVGEVFTIALAGNPTTGYTWQADPPVRYLALEEQTFEPGGPGIGAGGWEVFRFRAVGAGEAEIGFAYRRPWEGEPRETVHFRATIG